MVYLATDPDREGESIAWHISEALELDPARTQRITFNEITKTAVQKALASPSSINEMRVQAQEARRVLDRVVGYPLSNLLGKKVTRGLSAGRVQSVAVKLIVDREREIEAFKTEEFWKITALLALKGTVKFQADPAKAKVFAKKRGDHLKKDVEADPEAAEKEPAAQDPGRELPGGVDALGRQRICGDHGSTGRCRLCRAEYGQLRRHEGRSEGRTTPSAGALHYVVTATGS